MKKTKTVKTNNNFKIDMKLVKMQDVKFNDDLFIPMKTKTIVDSVLSTEGGVFPGTNTVVIGDPGVGKSTVLLDWICNMQTQGKKVLFISGEMNDIDMYGYVKRFPKFGKVPIMFMGDYSDCPKQAVEQVLNQGYDVVLMDSWAEVTSMVKDQMTTAMAALRFDGRGADAERYIEFSKNRRGSVGDKIYFSLHRGGCVDYSFEMVD